MSWSSRRMMRKGSGSSGGSGALRFATANNQHPLVLQKYQLNSTGAASPPSTVDMMQIEPHVIGADCTSITPAITNQVLNSGLGVKNSGSSISIIEMYIGYNGVTVSMTLAGATSATVADAVNVLFDAMPSTLFGGAAKFTKGTTLTVRMHFQTTAPSTQFFPTTNSRLTGQSQVTYDATQINITNGGVSGTGSTLTYGFKTIATAVGATASGTTVTLNIPTASIVVGKKYTVAGATGTGNALFYNQANTVLTIVDANTATYTAVQGAPTATATGTVIVTGNNGTDALFGLMIPMFVLGNHTSVTPIFLGDSKTYGTGDTATAISVIGMTRALFSNASTASTVVWPGCNFGDPNGVSADPITAAGGSLANFEAWYAYGTHAILGYGTNGFQVANQQTLYAHVRAKGITQIVQRSLTPRCTSSDSFTTLGGQTLNAAWGVGSGADTYEASLRALVSGDANLTYYQSLGERSDPNPANANYWLWFVDGTANKATSDGTHEGGTTPGYELNINSGTVTTQAGGTVTQSLRALIAAFV